MTTTKTKAVEAEAPPKTELHVFNWRVASAGLLRETSDTAEYEPNVDAFLQERGYTLLNGGPTPLEIWEAPSEDTPARFQVIGRYPRVTLLFPMPDLRHLESFMQEYGNIAATLHYRLLPKPVPPPDNYTKFYPVATPRQTW